jgi:hypothetical protein
MLQCINGVSSNPVEGRTKILLFSNTNIPDFNFSTDPWGSPAETLQKKTNCLLILSDVDLAGI